MAPHVFIRDGSHSNPVLRPVDIDNMSYDELLDLERQLGQVRSPGASMEQISELPAFAYHRAPDDKKQSSAAPKSCAICMEELAPSTGIFDVLLPFRSVPFKTRFLNRRLRLLSS